MLQSIGTRPHGRGRNEIPERERNDRRTPLACPISRWHPGADRCRRVLLDPGRARGLDPQVPRPPCLHQHGQDAHLRPARTPPPPVRRLPAGRAETQEARTRPPPPPQLPPTPPPHPPP